MIAMFRMMFRMKLQAGLYLFAALLLAAAFTLPGASAQTFTAPQRSEIETIIRNYLLKNPEIMQDVMAELEKRQMAAELEKAKDAIVKNKDVIFDSPRQVVLGNPKGDVTMVEFFDYNCGYCKRAMDDMMQLLKSDPNLKVVLKELPLLGEGSEQAAQVAAAVSMQDKSGKKYLAFHQKLMSGRGQNDKAKALAAAKDVGVDMARLEKDMASPELAEYINEGKMIAQGLGVSGTPSYVIGNEMVVGAVGVADLKAKIGMARCGKVTC